MLRFLARLPRIWRRNEFDDALAHATSSAGTRGIGALDLLVAVLATSSEVRRVVAAVPADPQTIWAAAETPDHLRAPGPGLSEDGKRIIEAVSGRALRTRHDPTAVDLLLALATVDGPARDLLAAHGVRRELLPD